ncbi:MAG: tetratricopeptide repeat protein [Acidimicrobiales bacterium]|nr:tetratricopeptide repeat protein [Acidimicrobiales bacterium]
MPIEVRLPQVLGDTVGRRLAGRVKSAANAFEAERYGDAARTLRPIVEKAPEVPEVRELYGLVLYRQGKWREAVQHLEAFRTLSGTAEQNPVLSDCYRAMGRYQDADALWEELREASPDAATVTEGRIVAAASLVDRGRLQEALRLLEAGWKTPKRPREHHLRRAYALADLTERLGGLARARELFGWVAGHDPGFADVAARIAALR